MQGGESPHAGSGSWLTFLPPQIQHTEPSANTGWPSPARAGDHSDANGRSATPAALPTSPQPHPEVGAAVAVNPHASSGSRRVWGLRVRRAAKVPTPGVGPAGCGDYG